MFRTAAFKLRDTFLLFETCVSAQVEHCHSTTIGSDRLMCSLL